MEPSISQVVQEAGQKVCASTGDLAEALNQALNQLIDWPFQAATGLAMDAERQKTDVFSALIYAGEELKATEEFPEVNADNLACVIDVAESIDIEQLHAAYERIAVAKRLKKSPVPKVSEVPITNIILGIIFAREATVSMEDLAEKLDHLNNRHPDREWTDMVVVLSKGTINYAVQFPGEGISGDFLPPAEGASERYSPAVFVTILIKPTQVFAFNKMCAFLFAHLMIFSPSAKLPRWDKILEGTSKQGLTITSYQYDLSGNLKPVPPQFYNDRYLPPRPFLIEDQQGKLLSTLQFMPWQDGGVVLLKGKLPLDGLLVFLGKKVIERGGIVQRDDGQISHVLPIIQDDFMVLIQRIQKQTNMVVKLDKTKLVAQKLADEGSSSPFFARLYMGILRLRNEVFPDPSKQEIFDKPYHFVIETMLNTRSTSNDIIQLVADHISKLEKGEIGKLRGNTIHIEETIDKKLRKEVESFLNSGVRVLKQGMQDLTNSLQINVGFLFKKQQTFENQLAEMEESDPLLAAYLREARKWTERLVLNRNAIEHEGWIMPRLIYKEVNAAICAEEPKISGQKVSEYVEYMINRLCCFVEEVTAYCLQTKMPEGFSVTEIPLSQRKPGIPERFQMTITHGGKPIWNLSYHDKKFDQA